MPSLHPDKIAALAQIGRKRRPRPAPAAADPGLVQNLAAHLAAQQMRGKL